MDKKTAKHMIELFDGLTLEKKVLFMDYLEKLSGTKVKKETVLTDAGAIIDRTLDLFDCWRENEDRLRLGLIFKAGLMTRYNVNEITTDDISEITGFVGAMRMFGKI